MADGVPEVLFVCVRNAARSQMAAAFLEELAGDRVRVRSAGTAPAEDLDDGVVEAMREAGVDLAGRRPTALRDRAVREADVVVTMGCEDRCPVYPGKRYEEWDLADPAGRSLEEVRAVRDEIRRRVQVLLERLDG